MEYIIGGILFGCMYITMRYINCTDTELILDKYDFIKLVIICVLGPIATYYVTIVAVGAAFLGLVCYVAQQVWKTLPTITIHIKL